MFISSSHSIFGLTLRYPTYSFISCTKLDLIQVHPPTDADAVLLLYKYNNDRTKIYLSCWCPSSNNTIYGTIVLSSCFFAIRIFFWIYFYHKTYVSFWEMFFSSSSHIVGVRECAGVCLHVVCVRLCLWNEVISSVDVE